MLPFVLSILVTMSSVTRYVPICGSSDVSIRQQIASLLNEVALQRGVTRLDRLRNCRLCGNRRISCRGLESTTNSVDCNYVRKFGLANRGIQGTFRTVRGCVIRRAHLKVPIFAMARSLRNSMRSNSAVFPRSMTINDAFGLSLTCRVAGTVTARLESRKMVRALSPKLSIIQSLQ